MAAIDPDTYTIEHVHIAGTITDDARLESLAGAGPLALSDMHLLATLCPGRVTTATGPSPPKSHVIDLTNVDFVTVPSLLLSDDMLAGTTNFAIKAARFTRF